MCRLLDNAVSMVWQKNANVLLFFIEPSHNTFLVCKGCRDCCGGTQDSRQENPNQQNCQGCFEVVYVATSVSCHHESELLAGVLTKIAHQLRWFSTNDGDSDRTFRRLGCPKIKRIYGLASIPTV
jgi:hypothetical protein